MKKLTANEGITAGKLWDAGYGVNAIAAAVDDKRRDIDMYYLAVQVADELVNRVGIGGEGIEYDRTL